MDKIKELLQDRNNMIIAIAIAVVLILGIVVLIGVMSRRGAKTGNESSATQSSSTVAPAIQGGQLPPGNIPGMPNTPGIPNSFAPGMQGTSSVAPQETLVSDASDNIDNPLKGKPQETGRIDPFAPIGVAKASKTKSFGDAIKSRMAEEGVNWEIPSMISAVSFTDYIPGQTKIGYMKTAADFKREKEKLEAKKKAEQDKINAVIYTKPSTIRLSGIIKGSKGTVATLQVNANGRDDYKSVSVGEEFIYGYNGYSPLKAVVKSIDVESKTVILKPKGTDIEWKFNQYQSNRNLGYGSTGYGFGRPSSFGTNPINPGIGNNYSMPPVGQSNIPPMLSGY